MGATIWLEVNDGTASNSPDNSMLLRLESELARLAGDLKVRPLTDFYGYGVVADEAAAELADELGDMGVERPPACEGWFDSREGLASFQALADQLGAHPESLGFKPARGQDHWPQMLLEELAYCTTRLREAAAHGHGFRLEIVP